MLPQRLIRPDYLYNNKIIEFFGDNIHGNPSKYTADDILTFYRCKIRAADIWKKDKIRFEILHNKGFQILVVWEAEYKEDPTSVIMRCEAFLRD
jgi:hypothetical protein